MSDANPPVQAQFQRHYGDLRRLAHSRLRRDGGGFAINTTALVNECFIRLHGIGSLDNAQRTSFLSYASQTMRSIIVDIVRAELSDRRGAGATMVTLDTMLADSIPGGQDAEHFIDVLAVDRALTELEQLDARLARVVELRYFGGLTFAEVAEVLGVTMRTVQRDWDKARMLLAVSLGRNTN